MKVLSIDIETYSSVDLIKSGVYPYVEAPDFTILLMSYAFDDGSVEILDLVEQEIPADLVALLKDPDVLKTAFNANFERICLSRFLDIPLPPEQWECTAAKALTLGLPGDLKRVAEVLGVNQQKMARGGLINYYTKPCKPTGANMERTRNLPEHNPDRWEQFKSYCKQDVEVERAIRDHLKCYATPAKERQLWILDQRMNDRGVNMDRRLIQQALKCDGQNAEELLMEAKEITGLENPNSIAQLKKWVEQKLGTSVESLNKESVQELLKTCGDQQVKEVLKLRVRMAKASVSKYKAMDRALCNDGRIRGLLQYYGANRTGRWAGRIVQIHNLPKNEIPNLDFARNLLLEGDKEGLELFFGSVSHVLSQLVRTAFIPSKGRTFAVADFSAIEARIIAWLAGEKWRMDVFRTHGKLYEASAAQMFHVPIETVTKGSQLRQKGKAAELALGYQGSVGAMIKMGALKMGLAEDELPEIVDNWRLANPHIVKLWKLMQQAAIKAVKDQCAVEVMGRVKFIYRQGYLFTKLPSGRYLAYARPRIEIAGQWNQETLIYDGLNQTKKKWESVETYGGKLTENVVQAIARDCLAESMLKLDQKGYDIVMHVHDEVVLDVPKQPGILEDVCGIMGEPAAWAKDLPLTADAYMTDYYRKD